MSTLTFLLAMLAYLDLTILVAWSPFGRPPLILARITAVLAGAHVFLVWTVRYDWHLSSATRNGYVGFVLFHTALLILIASALVARWTAWLQRLAFAVVSLGALGAVFRYDEVALYRLPVVLCVACGGVGLFIAGRRWLRSKKSSKEK